LLTLRGHGRPVAGVAFSAEGNYLVTCSDDKTLKLWDAHVAPEATLLGEFDSWVNHVAFSRDGKQIAAGAVDRSIRVWDSSTGAVLIERRDLPSPVWSVRFSPDGRRLACGLGDWTKPDQPAETKILDAMTGREYYSLRGHQALVWSVAFSPDGERIATARFIARTQKLIECFLRLAYIGDVTLITAVHFVIHPTHCSIFESLATGDEPLSIHINVKHATREQPVAKPSMNTNHVMQMSP
jgi:WD40 repeat protein